MSFKKLIAAASVMAMSTAALAASGTQVYSDDFNSNTTGTNKDPANWTTPVGTVDIIGNGFYDYCGSGHGLCVDLDGSTKTAANPLLSQTFTAQANTLYTAEFELRGSTLDPAVVFQQYGITVGATDTVTVTFGSSSPMAHTFNWADGWQAFTMSFTALSSGPYTLTFANGGGDNVGALLDNVKIFAQAVPEPEQYAMFLAGLGLMGFMAARRRRM